MVTFAIPGDDNAAVVAKAALGTPGSRPPLSFSQRTFPKSPFGGPGKKLLGTPRTASSANQGYLGRDDVSSHQHLSRNSIATARNIFRASNISDSPPTVFSPSLPAGTMNKVFAPGGTPDPSRTYRDSVASATPRGMAAKASTQDLFSMRIPSPSADLSGEALTRQVPQEWSSKNSIYADQYLAHHCPPDFDDEQRRQFFCILDLRRLKYAADEIFVKKDWKLNVVNFAKEFEKSRSIILLRYGLYKFQNVQPSKEVMRRWRRDHGLPDLEDEEGHSNSAKTPTRPLGSKKRKAAEDTTRSRNKRRADDEDEGEDDNKNEAEKAKPIPKPAEPPAVTGKRVHVEDEEEEEAEPRSKMQKSTPSAAKSLFEKVANKSAATTTSTTPAKPSLFSAQPPDNSAKSVFAGLKPGTNRAGSGSSNIFGHLSDNSPQNSGVEGDAESETDSDGDDKPDESNDPAETASDAGNPLVKKSSLDSVNGTRESTPGRSLFDRVEKGSNGETVRADTHGTPAKPADQTWNPSTTPLKFAPTTSAAPSSHLFGASTPAGSVFGAKPSAAAGPSSLFGAPRKDQPAPSSASAVGEKEAGESDKENAAQAAKPLFGLSGSGSAGAAAAAAAASTPSTLFGSKPAETSEPAAPSDQPSANLFGSAAKPDAAAAASQASHVFGKVNGPFTSAPASQTSNLFGATPSDSSSTPAVKSATPSFGLANPSSTAEKPASGLFGSTKPSPHTANIFGKGASSTPGSGLFGASKATPSEPASQTSLFSFGGSTASTNGSTAKPLFGAPKSPPPPPAPSSNANLFGGSPMKQDEPSPVKRPFPGSAGDDSVPKFAFGANQNGGGATSSLFGGAIANGNGTVNPSTSFGGASQASNGSSFNFNFNGNGGGGGGSSVNSSFNNPFASGGAANGEKLDANTGSGGLFNFSSGNAAPASGNSSPFHFGGGGAANGTTSAPSAGSSFGGQGNTGSGGAPIFNFGGTSQPPAATTNVFGANPNPPSFGNLQAGGASTTGTNTPLTIGGGGGGGVGGGGSSLATTPAAGTPEPSSHQAGDAAEGAEGEAQKDEQVNLTEGTETEEEVLHEVRAKALKLVTADPSEDMVKPKSPWTTKGLGSLKLLRHRESGVVRLLLRAEPRGNVVMNRAVLPEMDYVANEKYVKLATSNEEGDGLETWMIQVKTKDMAKALAESLEKSKGLNK